MTPDIVQKLNTIFQDTKINDKKIEYNELFLTSEIQTNTLETNLLLVIRINKESINIDN